MNSRQTDNLRRTQYKKVKFKKKCDQIAVLE